MDKRFAPWCSLTGPVNQEDRVSFAFSTALRCTGSSARLMPRAPRFLQRIDRGNDIVFDQRNAADAFGLRAERTCVFFKFLIGDLWIHFHIRLQA